MAKKQMASTDKVAAKAVDKAWWKKQQDGLKPSPTSPWRTDDYAGDPKRRVAGRVVDGKE